MITYTDCENCELGIHLKCLGWRESFGEIICTCAICNAMGFIGLIKPEMEQSKIQYIMEHVSWHIEHMYPKDIELFKEIYQQEKMKLI